RWTCGSSRCVVVRPRKPRLCTDRRQRRRTAMRPPLCTSRRRASLLAAVILALAACAARDTTAQGAGTVSASLPTATLAATAAPAPPPRPAPLHCGSTLLPTPDPAHFSAAGPFSGWNGVPAVPGTLIYSDAPRALDGVHTSSSSEAVGLCTPGVTPDAV